MSERSIEDWARELDCSPARAKVALDLLAKRGLIELDVLGRPYTGGDSCHKCDFNFPCWGDRSRCQRGLPK